jgi:hypothetical protein
MGDSGIICNGVLYVEYYTVSLSLPATAKKRRAWDNPKILRAVNINKHIRKCNKKELIFELYINFHKIQLHVYKRIRTTTTTQNLPLSRYWATELCKEAGLSNNVCASPVILSLNTFHNHNIFPCFFSIFKTYTYNFCNLRKILFLRLHISLCYVYNITFFFTYF